MALKYLLVKGTERSAEVDFGELLSVQMLETDSELVSNYDESIDVVYELTSISGSEKVEEINAAIESDKEARDLAVYNSLKSKYGWT